MLSAGLLGGPGIGFLQDVNASAALRASDRSVYERYKAGSENSFLWLKTVGLDGAKVGVLEDAGREALRALALLKQQDAKPDAIVNQQALVDWWQNVAATHAEADKPLVENAGLAGGRKALTLTAYVPAAMFVCYILLIGFFMMRGGYKQEVLDPELFTGGTVGSGEG